MEKEKNKLKKLNNYIKQKQKQHDKMEKEKNTYETRTGIYIQLTEFQREAILNALTSKSDKTYLLVIEF